jgi:hypothetical protein
MAKEEGIETALDFKGGGAALAGAMSELRDVHLLLH